MKKDLLNKTLVIGIILLFVCMCINPSSAVDNVKKSSTPVSNGNTLYVGGSGPNNYTRIQDAVDNTSDGDTVFVYDDSSPYYENLWITKSINLIGEDKNLTIIDGQNITGKDTIFITGNNVKISGFTITHAGTSLGDAGINIINSINNNITNNIITQNEDHGIYLDNSDGNIISQNIISWTQGDWYMGVTVWDSNYNIFFENYICSNGYGFSLAYANYNIIIENQIINSNELSGIWAQYCNSNIICYNNISNNKGRGIDFYDSHENSIYENTILGNGWGTIPGTVGGDGICLRVGSGNNLVKRNIIINNTYDGISFHSGINNIIIENIFSENNRRGIDQSGTETLNNQIYHNSFIKNPVNALDQGVNIWHNGYPSGGNYWDDYTGEDNNGDGIGDIPYNIPGGNNKDLYPFMESRIPPFSNFNYLIWFSKVTFDGSLSFDFDGSIYSYDWDFGDGAIENGMIINHTYTSKGVYNVTLTVTDDDGYKSNRTKNVTIKEIQYPPYKPSINGTNSGKVGIEYIYTFVTTDPDNDPVEYYIEWGDDDFENWFGPFSSGDPQNKSHIWTIQGTYIIKAKARDIYGQEGIWGMLLVTIPRNKMVNTQLFKFLEDHLNLFKLIQVFFQ